MSDKPQRVSGDCLFCGHFHPASSSYCFACRDHFAIAALTAIVTQGDTHYERAVIEAYQIADEMMKVRLYATVEK